MKFFIRATVLAVILLALTYFLQHVASVDFIGSFAYSSLAFFYLLTLIIIIIIAGAVRKANNRKVVNMITASVAIKLFGSILFVVISLFINKPSSVLIIVPFFFYYVLFTIIEVAEMLRLNKLSTKN